MSSKEIVEGLRNAIQRGYSLEQAKQSFINAGFNREEVESAAASLVGISNSFVQQQPIQQQTQQPRMPQLPANVPQPKMSMPEIKPLPTSVYQKAESHKSMGLIIFLVIVLILLLGVLAASFIFKEQILNLISG